MEKSMKVLDLVEGKKVLGYLNTAYKDYIGARHLYNSNLLHQATIFANTSLEKCIKAYLYVTDTKYSSKHHDTYKLYTALKNFNPRIGNEINPEFIKVISKIYLSRYFESLNPGYNFVIVRNKFLAELDYTFQLLNDLIEIPSPIPTPSPFKYDKQTKNPLLINNNYLLNNIDKEVFLNFNDNVYEFRILDNHQAIELFYSIPNNKEHDKFMYTALVPDGKNGLIISNNHPPVTEMKLNGHVRPTLK
jgi:HEPN domain-containing protein